MGSHDAFLLGLVFLAAAGPTSQSDLEKYVAAARQSRMSEIAAGQLQTYAGILGGGGMFKVQLTAEGTVARSWTGAMCCLPETEPGQRAELQQTIQAKRDTWLAYLKKVADTDGSGFVSAEEGRTLGRRMYIGLTVAQLPKVQSLDELAELLEGEASELAKDLDAFMELQIAAQHEGMTGLPALPQKWLRAHTP